MYSIIGSMKNGRKILSCWIIHCAMKINICILFNCLLFCLGNAQNPSIEIISSGTKTSLRGLSVVNDNIIWVSGSNGTVGRSTNAGKNWKWISKEGFHVCRIARIGTTIFLAGNNGKIGKIVWK